jgi:hypothetical protein
MERQVGAQPVEGLFVQARALAVVELRGVLAAPGGGEDGADGGGVAMTGAEVLGKLGIGGEGVDVELDGCVVKVLGRRRPAAVRRQPPCRRRPQPSSGE